MLLNSLENSMLKCRVTTRKVLVYAQILSRIQPITAVFPPTEALLHLGLADSKARLPMCHPCVSVCHPLKRCKPFVHRGCVSLSPFIAKNPMFMTYACPNDPKYYHRI